MLADDVTVTTAQDGQLTVIERIVTDAPAIHRIAERVPVTDDEDRLYSITELHVSGAASAEGTTVTVTGPATVMYTVDGAVAAGQVRFQLTGGWDRAVDRVTAAFSGPEVSTADCYAGQPGSSRQCTFSELRSGGAHAEQNGLRKGDRIDLAVHTGPLPENARFLPTGPLAAFAPGFPSVLSGLALVFYLVIGAAVLRRRARSGELDLTGTVLDLVARGHLHIADGQVSHGEADPLTPFEQAVKTAFPPGPLAAARPDQTELRALLDAEAHRHGKLSTKQPHVRRAGLILAAAGIVTTVVLAFTVGEALIGVALLIAGIATSLAAPLVHPRRGRALGRPTVRAESPLAAEIDAIQAMAERRSAVAAQ